MSNWTVLALSLGTLIAGLIWFYFGWRAIQRDKRHAKDSARWPTTSSHIKTSQVVSELRGDVRNDIPVVEYSYVVRGQTYMAKRVSFDAAATLMANQVVAKYPVGSEVPVAYDPANPAVAVLQPGGRGPGALAYTLALIGPIILILAGIAMLFIF